MASPALCLRVVLGSVYNVGRVIGGFSGLSSSLWLRLFEGRYPLKGCGQQVLISSSLFLTILKFPLKDLYLKFESVDVGVARRVAWCRAESIRVVSVVSSASIQTKYRPYRLVPTV